MSELKFNLELIKLVFSHFDILFKKKKKREENRWEDTFGLHCSILNKYTSKYGYFHQN